MDPNMAIFPKQENGSMSLLRQKMEGCVWTKPSLWKWTNEDLPIVCLASYAYFKTN